MVIVTTLLCGAIALSQTGCASLSALAMTPDPTAPDFRPPLSETEMELKQANFHIVRANISGHSNGFKLLGLFTIVPPTKTKAFKQMYKNSHIVPEGPLTPVHIVVEAVDNSFVLFSIPQIYVRADFVIFDKPTGSPPEKGLN